VAAAIGGRRAPVAMDRGEGSASTGEPTRVQETDWLSSKRPKTAWPHEGGRAGTAVPAAATTSGNWPWQAPAREEGRHGGHGGELYLAYD
jgi:hypothetical protein